MLRSCLLFSKVNLLRVYTDPLFSWISLPPGSVQGTESGSLWYTVGACCLLCANVKVLIAPWGPAPCSPVDSVHSTSVPCSPLLPWLLPFPLDIYAFLLCICVSAKISRVSVRCSLGELQVGGKGTWVQGVQRLLTGPLRSGPSFVTFGWCSIGHTSGSLSASVFPSIQWAEGSI